MLFIHTQQVIRKQKLREDKEGDHTQQVIRKQKLRDDKEGDEDEEGIEIEEEEE